MLSQFRGLVLSEFAWGENDKMLSILTAEYGKVSVLLKGGASLKNKAGGACLPMCYSSFVTADKGGRPWIREAVELADFSNIRTDLELTATALYMCDIASEVCVENGDESEMLQLMLNTFYALDKGLKPRKLIKAAFELRVASVIGFAPDLVKCSDCGSEAGELMYIEVMDGVMHCAECRRNRNSIPKEMREGHTELLLLVEKTLLDAMRYVSYCPAKRYLSFDLPEIYHSLFEDYCEKYLLNHIDKGFHSLNFLHSLDYLPK